MNQTPTPAPWRSMAVRYTKNSKSPFKNPVNNFNKILDGITQNSPLVPCLGRQKVDLSQDPSPRSTTRRCGAGKTRGQTAPRKSNLGQQAHRGSLGQSWIQVE